MVPRSTRAPGQGRRCSEQHGAAESHTNRVKSHYMMGEGCCRPPLLEQSQPSSWRVHPHPHVPHPLPPRLPEAGGRRVVWKNRSLVLGVRLAHGRQRGSGSGMCEATIGGVQARHEVVRRLRARGGV